MQSVSRAMHNVAGSEVAHDRRPGMNAPIAQVPIQRVCGPGRLESIDDLAIEEPLEIRLDFSGPDGPEHQTLSITMRTPGQDDELAVGFLMTEGVIRGPGDLREVRPYLPDSPRPGRANVPTMWTCGQPTRFPPRLQVPSGAAPTRSARPRAPAC